MIKKTKNNSNKKNEDQKWIKILNEIKCLGMKLKKKTSKNIRNKINNNKKNMNQN
jgi:hypothetical protein